jgi:hypothetical protein
MSTIKLITRRLFSSMIATVDRTATQYRSQAHIYKWLAVLFDGCDLPAEGAGSGSEKGIRRLRYDASLKQSAIKFQEMRRFGSRLLLQL